MKKIFKRKDEVEIAHHEDFLTLLQEIKQQLIFLERKIDALTIQPQERHRDRSYSRDRSARAGGFRERGFTKAICAQCNKECEVPFKPSGDRPVYCQDCFAKREGGGWERHGGHRFGKRQGGEGRGFGKRKPTPFRRHN